ncbi:DnaJ domain-containing protein [Spironucleus salmonicida]|uniref:DnaJ domain-containing protein n=1 Tax=Spironucleus salmonicida TaxID=348837 RepID=V6LSA3_9EUKA|nr:DnaJ domain-containing protein [Spironucleus salmonicida]|eukprot:EST47542.1 DnaJ domain-containing protein [Spironucleus salmonicida]
MPTAYEILDVPENCTDDRLIKSSYHQLAQKYHPDRAKDEDKDVAQEMMQKINDAYAAVKNEEARKAYAMAQTAKFDFTGGDYAIYVSKSQFVLEKDFKTMLKKWIKTLSLRPMGMSFIKKSQQSFCGKLKFVVLKQQIEIKCILDVKRKSEQHPTSETLSSYIPLEMAVTIKINSLNDLKEAFIDAPEKLLKDIQPYINNFSCQIGTEHLTKTNEVQQLNQEDVEITEQMLSSMQMKLMKEMFKVQFKMQSEFLQKNNDVESFQIVDMGMDMVNADEQVQVIECECQLFEYEFKGKQHVLCANMVSGDMVGSYDKSGIKQKIVNKITNKLEQIMEKQMERSVM